MSNFNKRNDRSGGNAQTQPASPPAQRVEVVPGEDKNGLPLDFDMSDKMPTDRPPLEAANDAVWRLWLQGHSILSDLQRVLLGPLAGDLRMAAALEKCQFGGDARQWEPIKKLFAVIMRLKPRDGAQPGVVTGDPESLKNPTSL